jgi:hypothetical protein
MWLIKHKTTKAYLNKWFGKRERTGHWVESKAEAKPLTKKQAKEIEETLEGKVEMLKEVKR